MRPNQLEVVRLRESKVWFSLEASVSSVRSIDHGRVSMENRLQESVHKDHSSWGLGGRSVLWFSCSAFHASKASIGTSIVSMSGRGSDQAIMWMSSTDSRPMGEVPPAGRFLLEAKEEDMADVLVA